MKKLLFAAAAALGLLGACTTGDSAGPDATDSGKEFVRVEGSFMLTPDGDTLFIRGTNLGNWLNPEGYMFGFSRTNSARMINDMFCELVGEEFTADFWKQFKDNYITRSDIEFIASTGANTIRLPFHYKLFTDEDYMGLTSGQDGFDRIDSVVTWCRDNGLYLILDMHDAPGGQTGDNIDDSYAYPWLLRSENHQRKFCGIWHDIAERYAGEPTILAYELINEPVAHFFPDKDELNAALAPLLQRAVDTIRTVDPNHIILIGAPQWNSNFEPLSGHDFGENIAYTCHRYGGPATAEAIASYIAFRDSTGLPMYMGEIGHNTDQWQNDFVRVMEDNNIGYTFWPYKKLENSCMMGIRRPEGWDSIVAFAEGSRGSFAEVRENRPSPVAAMNAMLRFIENSRAENCMMQNSYIESMNLTIPQ